MTTTTGSKSAALPPPIPPTTAARIYSPTTTTSTPITLLSPLNTKTTFNKHRLATTSSQLQTPKQPSTNTNSPPPPLTSKYQNSHQLTRCHVNTSISGDITKGYEIN
ncbi:hypothetical protein QL285_074840 [Trifolium repens]|jgi:hypothetical protein|nr:hypothetical protein QL285_074840 [Trifolium repens]